ncbi:polyphenol oxidase family protein [bacterium]|nr:polyphenol oxidase family protein [bacterium]
MTPSWIQYGFSIEPKGQTAPYFEQVHGREVIDLDTPATGLPKADAGFTRRNGQEVFAFTADCLPVLLYGPRPDSAIAAIHAGWRGALAGIIRATLESWPENTSETTAILGPSLGVCCFQVREDFVRAFQEAGKPVERFLQERAGSLYFDLTRYAVEIELAGVALIVDKHVKCTFCSEPLLPSYRRNGKADPRIRSWIRKI